jgi:hypothetical protein
MKQPANKPISHNHSGQGNMQQQRSRSRRSQWLLCQFPFQPLAAFENILHRLPENLSPGFRLGV